MKKQNTSKTLTFVIITFVVYFILDQLYFNVLRGWFNEKINSIGVSHIITYTLSLIPLVLGLYILHNSFRSAIKSMGLDQSFLKALAFCFLATLPIFIGNMIFFEWQINLKINNLLITVLAAAVFEEIIFRGFLFGQLFRHTRLGFFPSILLGAVIFGLLHLYQSEDLMSGVGIFGVTFAGSLLFGWAYAEWNFNLWTPILLHFFMNLFFELFGSGENALGGITMNLIRISSVFAIIALTVFYKKRNSIKFVVDKNQLWWKPSIQ